MSNIGFRIYTKVNRPDAKIVEAFRKLCTPNIADNMNRFGCVDAAIKPINQKPGIKMLGTAFTVRSRVADNLLFHKALDMASPGDIIVIDAQGDMNNAVCGEIMARYAESRGLAGFLIDGCIRDAGALRSMDFPVFARGANPKGPYKDGPGEINVPVTCGGIVINPGDIIVGDEDGVVIIKPEEAEEILNKTLETEAKEKKAFEAIEKGTWDRSWVDKTLKEKGCEIID
jgi:RraA family protein